MKAYDRLTIDIIKEYQDRWYASKHTASEFKSIGLELRDRFNLLDIEAINLINNVNIAEIFSKYN